ncbi:unnamed protein product, partial [Mesorhabditis spiculigera]
MEEPIARLRLGEFELGQTIGTGTFGKVKVAVSTKTGMTVAVKIISHSIIKRLDMAKKIRREIENMSRFSHPHIIQLYGVVSTPSDIFMVMEYASGGELFDYITKHGQLAPEEARRFFQQIIAGVNYCHKHLVVHRDLKPENLLLDQYNNVKIADFGLSNMMHDGDFLRTSCGSPNYAAPEVLCGNFYCGPEVDIWSCGVILYALLAGTLPFDDDSIHALFKKIKAGIYFIPTHFDDEVSNLLQMMLQVDPMKRATMQDIIGHEWFTTDLASCLFPNSNETSNIVDVSVIEELSKLYHMPEAEITTALLANEANDISQAYDELIKVKRAVSDQQSPSTRNNSLHLDLGLAGLSLFGVGSPGSNSSSYSTPRPRLDASPLSEPLASPARSTRKAAKWHLGIRSHAKPHEIMGELFQALKRLDYEWIIVDPYHVVVRKKMRPGMSKAPNIGLQLYEFRSSYYLLDFKSLVEESNSPTSTEQSSPSDSMVDFEGLDVKELQDDISAYITPRGSTLPFFEMCTELLSQLIK